jgi:very-short-patch-repair endonuclease
MALEFARRLRRDMTDAERAMWRILRGRQLAGYKFRRQQPIDHYIVDFVCFSHRLVIEIDGSQHMDSKPDEIRSRYLARNGFRILRFWNNEVLANREGIAERIHETLHEPPHPPVAARRAPPSPARGEG